MLIELDREIGPTGDFERTAPRAPAVGEEEKIIIPELVRVVGPEVESQLRSPPVCWHRRVSSGSKHR